MTSAQTVRERPKSTRQRPAAGTPPRSTRSTRSTRPQAGEAPRSTRRPSTRKAPQAVSEAPVKSSTPKRMIRTEPVAQDKPTPVRKGKKSTRNVIRTEPTDITRTEIFTEKREQARFLAPAQFLLVMFGVIVISVFAFGLLRGGEEQALPEKPDPNEVIEFEPNSTSTNTGILRGNGD